MSGTIWLFRSASQIHKMCLPTLLLTAKLQEERGNGLSLNHPQDNLKMINLWLSSSATQQVSALLSSSRNQFIYWCCIHYCFFLGMAPGTLTPCCWDTHLEKFCTLNQGSYGDKINIKTMPHSVFSAMHIIYFYKCTGTLQACLS